MRRRDAVSSWWMFLCLLAFGARAQTTALDARVQPPQLKAPERGSLAGPLAGTAFGPADVSGGGFSLASTFALPGERGSALVQPFPSYSPDKGLSEWGMGWGNTLSITRWRALGAIDYATDELTGPWGRMVRGADQRWYAAGFQSQVRVEEVGDTLVAVQPDGSRWTFGGAERTETAKGTYAWYLTRVETSLGRQAQLTYEHNASGRRFLKSLSYGGLGADFQDQVELEYTTLARPFRDVRSGSEVQLDRRVSTVITRVRNAQSGLWEERWRHVLTYEEEGLGPAYFLAGVTQSFPSGQSLPSMRYTYHRSAERLGAAALTAAPPLDAVLASEGTLATQPDQASLLDVDEDGRLDLENHEDYTLWRQQDGAFVAEAPPVPAPGASADCWRAPSASNPPRLLAQLRNGDSAHQVLGMRTQSSNAETLLTVCTRAGETLQTQVLPGGNWIPSANVKLADINKDLQPDFVRVSAGSYSVLPNTSTGGTFSFGARLQGTLRPSFTPTASWVHDFNGDGLADLIARYSSGVVVWLGRGDGTFLDAGLVYNVKYGNSNVTNLADFHFTFVDANKDGLADLLLTRQTGGTGSFFYVNNGKDFVYVKVEGLLNLPSSASKPVVGDFSGSGNTEVSYVINGHAWALALDTAQTGLLASADDGRGTVLRFEYGRAPARPGIRSRPTVLSALVSESSGAGSVRHTYQYDAPTLHSRARFLVGFGDVIHNGPGLVTEAHFLHADDYAGLPSSETRHDLQVPGLHTYTYRQYEDALYQGIAWKRLKEEGSGWAQDDGQALGERTEYVAYADGRCPTRTVRYTRDGMLTTEAWLATVPALADALHCVTERTRVTGTHTDASLDFQNEVHLTRDAKGLVESVESITPDETLLVQQVTYRPDSLIQSVTVPGQGTTTFEYEPGTLLLRRATSPDGVVLEATQRDALTDSILSLTTVRGARGYTQSFRYDGLERLERQWDSLGGASATNPNSQLTYRYATATQPGSILTRTLVDAATGAGTTRVEWQTADGEAVASAVAIPEGWAVQDVTMKDRALLESRTYARAPLDAAVDLSAVDYGTLLAGADVLGVLRSSGLGHEAEALSHLQVGVTRDVLTGLVLEGGLLKQESVENGTHTTRHYLDAGRRVLAVENEASVRTSFEYDALGRLRRVWLPDGTTHFVSFDGHGRVSRVVREGVASVGFTYEPVTGLLAKKTFLSSTGAPVREEAYTHDAIGRTVRVRHTDLAAGGFRDYVFYFDGATPEEPARTDWPGLLTAVAGDGYTRKTEYRVDGTPLKRTLALTGWRTVETRLGLRDDGSTREEETCVREQDGTLVTCVDMVYDTDTYGRTRGVSVNGVPLVAIDHDAQGRVAAATINGDTQVSFSYDALTRVSNGFSQSRAATGFFSSTSWSHNARGLIDTENLSVAGLSLVRSHTYSPEGYLTGTSDARDTYGYTYGDTGLPESVAQAGQVRSLVMRGNVLQAGGATYLFDGVGRTVARDGLTLVYGPDGQLARAERGTDAWTFVHDETGHRLAKLSGGAHLAAYLEGGGYLDATGLTQPLRVGGRLLGVLVNGAWRPLATDMRGTVVSDDSGAPLPASPYGDRASRPQTAAYDFVERAYDADLGLVRLGVRDYDPAISRFLTPDPLFLEEPQRCLSSTVSCNLYSYAANNPVSFTDREGQFEELVHGALTYRLAQLAGFTDRDAAIIAAYSAGVDHFSDTTPVDAINVLGGDTSFHHFNARMDEWLQAYADMPGGSLRDFGILLHGVEDVGYGTVYVHDAEYNYTYSYNIDGPHARGWPLYVPSVTLLSRVGHGMGLNEDWSGSIFFNHTADQAFRNPEGNRLLLMTVFKDLQRFAASYYGTGVSSMGNQEAALQEINTVLGITTDAQAQKYAWDSGYMGVTNQIQSSRLMPDGANLDELTGRHYDWVFDSSLP